MNSSQVSFPLRHLVSLTLISLLSACAGHKAVQQPAIPAASQQAKNPASAEEPLGPDLVEQLKTRKTPIVREEKPVVPEAQKSQTTYEPTVNATQPEDQLRAGRVAPQYVKAIFALKAGKLDEAYAMFDKVAQSAPTFSGPLINQGIILIRQQKFADAETTLSKAIGLNDKNPYAYNQLGIALREQGKFADARTAYEKSLALDGNYARAHFNLAVLADIYLQDLPLALQHYERYQALQTKPDTAVGNWIVDLQKRTGMWKPPVPPKPIPEPQSGSESEESVITQQGGSLANSLPAEATASGSTASANTTKNAATPAATGPATASTAGGQH